jgi:hypothetical protein
MKDEQLIHIRLGYSEAVQSKRDILEAERNFVQVLKDVKRYHLIRREELKLKLILLKKIKELKTNLNKINTIIPKIKIPEILRSDYAEKDTKKKVKEISGSAMRQTDIEKELMELQRKLKELE